LQRLIMALIACGISAMATAIEPSVREQVRVVRGRNHSALD